MGKTSSSLGHIFNYVRANPCVFMIDEIDGIMQFQKWYIRTVNTSQTLPVIQDAAGRRCQICPDLAGVSESGNFL